MTEAFDARSKREAGFTAGEESLIATTIGGVDAFNTFDARASRTASSSACRNISSPSGLTRHSVIPATIASVTASGCAFAVTPTMGIGLTSASLCVSVSAISRARIARARSSPLIVGIEQSVRIRSNGAPSCRARSQHVNAASPSFAVSITQRSVFNWLASRMRLAG